MKTGDNTEEEWISKSQRKRVCESLQKISDRLLKLKPDELALIDLPDELKNALQEAHHIHSNSALKRQRQYLGKIMRSCDSEKIQQQLVWIQGTEKTGGEKPVRDKTKAPADLPDAIGV